eukprot:TRINITY_DN94_c0_g1_i3.p1 TRINITY_DN94_c0_g1~~TRINITY_DN94_c0_g1_i3.p1  ORF type:complete len:473 (+),score=126.46 TRINITY_DN94_c0_g1_i3:98-1420(+)
MMARRSGLGISRNLIIMLIFVFCAFLVLVAALLRPAALDREALEYATAGAEDAAARRRRATGQGLQFIPATARPANPEVHNWLAGVGLAKYSQVFAEHEYDMRAVAALTESDLTAMGITAVGARRRLLVAARDLSAPASGGGSLRGTRGAVPEAPPDTTPWDFHGLPVPRTPAKGRIRLGVDVVTGYDLSKVDPEHPPPEYAPGDDPGFVYPKPNDTLFMTVSTKPRILYFPRIITDEEADQVKQMAQDHVRRSEVSLTQDQRGKNMSQVQDVRTSKQTWLDMHRTDFLRRIEARAQDIVGATWHEPMQVLNYRLGQHYDAHDDYFDPSRYGTQQDNRFATFFIYLTDVEEGGHTALPRAGGGPIPQDWYPKACGPQLGPYGLRSYPRKGAAVLFYSMRPDRSLDPYALHAGCAPVKGEKWSANLWFHTKTPGETGHVRY